MQPVFAYRPESYPPRGKIWPQFGDDVLEETLSISEGARQNLNKKKEPMSDFHKENLQHHGLAPREPPAREWYEDSDDEYAPGPGDPPAQRMDATDAVDPPRRPLSVHTGIGGRYDPPGSMEQGTQSASVTSTDQATQASVAEPMQVEPPKKKTLSYQRAFMTDAPSGRGEMGTQTSVPEEMDQEDIPTQYYGSDIEVDDQEMQRRVDKRPKPIKTERKVKIKVDPVKLEPVKTEVKVKKEPGAPLAAPQSSASSVLAPQRAARPDDDVQTTGVSFNNNTDMNFWEAASGNEIKSQLNLRFPHRSGDWQFKDRAQLISFVRGLIKRGQWVQGEAPSGPVRSSAAQRSAPYPWPAASAAPAVDPDDDDIQVGEVSWDTNQDPDYWAQQSSNYIRAQLTRRYPTQRHRFAFMKERQEYIDYITNLIKKGKW
jgi:hypothetical protein